MADEEKVDVVKQSKQTKWSSLISAVVVVIKIVLELCGVC